MLFFGIPEKLIILKVTVEYVKIRTEPTTTIINGLKQGDWMALLLF
jgi:hypothetical protein